MIIQIQKISLFIFLFITLAFAPIIHASIYTVTNTSEATGTGNCAVGGDCSLRQAINAANANLGADSILFNIPGPGPHTINLTSGLPIVTETVVIDGYSQPGALKRTAGATPGFANETPALLKIEINGGAQINIIALTLRGNGSTLQGLSFRGILPSATVSSGRYVVLEGTGGHTVVGNYFGLDPTGTTVTPTTTAQTPPFNVLVSSKNNVIGGLNPQDRNVFARSQRGLQISSADPLGGTPDNTQVLGNLFGIAADAVTEVDPSGRVIRMRQEDMYSFGGNNHVIEGNMFASNFGYQLRMQTSLCATNPEANSTGHVITKNLFVDSAEGSDIFDNVCINSTDTNPAPIRIVENTYINPQAAIILIGPSAITTLKNIVIEKNQVLGTNIPVASTTPPAPTGLTSVFAIFVRKGDNIRITENVFSGFSVMAVHIGPSAFGAAQNILISNNEIKNNNGIGIVVGGRTDSTFAPRNVTITNNQIHDNGKAGVVVASDPNPNDAIDANTYDVRVTSNNIYNNGGLAIDLTNNWQNVVIRDRQDLFSTITRTVPDSDGVTANDLLDLDSMVANNYQNFPVLDAHKSIINPALVIASGELNSIPMTKFLLEFYSDDDGQLKYFIGSTVVTTDSQGNATFYEIYKNPVAVAKSLTATATRLDGSDTPVETSEVSEAVSVRHGGDKGFENAQSSP